MTFLVTFNRYLVKDVIYTLKNVFSEHNLTVKLLTVGKKHCCDDSHLNQLLKLVTFVVVMIPA